MISDNGYILHARKYKDSSELLKLITKNHGIVDAIAKGSRSPKSKFRGQLQPFIDTEMTFTGKSHLKTLVHAEQIGTVKACSYVNHVSILYCNELMLLLNLDTDACRFIYPFYKQTIAELVSNERVSLVLRKFEWQLCCIQGYQITINDDINLEQPIEFDPIIGIKQSQREGLCKAQYLADFIDGKQLTQNGIKGLNVLMKNVVNHMVNGKTIQSRFLLK